MRGAIALVVGLLAATSGVRAEEIRIVRPVEIDDVLVNPGMGFTTR